MVFNVGNKEGVKVTVSSYYSPNGINIHGEGILPDVEVQLPEGVEGQLTIDNDTQLQKAVEILTGRFAIRKEGHCMFSETLGGI